MVVADEDLGCGGCPEVDGHMRYSAAWFGWQTICQPRTLEMGRQKLESFHECRPERVGRC